MDSQAIASLDEMPVLECPLCGAKFEYKKTAINIIAVSSYMFN